MVVERGKVDFSDTRNSSSQTYCVVTADLADHVDHVDVKAMDPPL